MTTAKRVTKLLHQAIDDRQRTADRARTEWFKHMDECRDCDFSTNYVCYDGDRLFSLFKATR